VIKKKTLFVLGAGASMPYGFPSGAELREHICSAHTGGRPLVNAVVNGCGVSPEHVEKFRDSFLRSSLPSIDAFLAKRPEFAEVGKLAIAYELCRRESPGRVIRPEGDDNWYKHLWAAMSWDAHGPAVLRNNQIRFVTFNYDRSLEFFLHESTKHSYGLDDAEALDAWKPIQILHVYGSLGEFHYLANDTARPYKPATDENTLRLAARALKVIPDARQGDIAFSMASEWLTWADTVCFLGFGFDRLNMERLGVSTTLELLRSNGAKTPRIVASTWGKTPSEVEAVRQVHLKGPLDFFSLDQQNLMTLRNTGILD